MRGGRVLGKNVIRADTGTKIDNYGQGVTNDDAAGELAGGAKSKTIPIHDSFGGNQAQQTTYVQPRAGHFSGPTPPQGTKADTEYDTV